MVKIVDLSVEVYPNMFKFPAKYHPEVIFEQTGTYEENLCMVHKIVMGTHSGTHIDSPLHFIKGGRSIDKVPLNLLVTNAYVIDVSPKESKEIISLSEIKKRENRIKGFKAIIFKTGWWNKWGSLDFYKDPPILDPKAAELLVNLGIRVFAVDFPVGIDIHKIVLGNDCFLIENIVNLDILKEGIVRLIALPLKLKGLDAAPARVIVVIE